MSCEFIIVFLSWWCSSQRALSVFPFFSLSIIDLLPRRGKGRAVPDRQLIRAEPKGPSLYQRKKGIETYSLSEEECHRGLMRQSRQQTGTGARWAWLPDWPGPGALGCCWSSVKFYQSVVLEQRSLRSTKLPSALILTREWNYFSTLPPNHLIDTWYPILWCHPMT